MASPGTFIGGKYRLVYLLGKGGMGQVWAAVNEATGVEIAVKLLLCESDDLRRRMMRETRVCENLEHKNLIRIHDRGVTDQGEPFLVMELLRGETLATLLSRTFKLEQRRAAQIARDVARGLSAVHRTGVVHRDLKPANIFLHRDGGDTVVKVLDFGIAKSIAESRAEERLTAHGGMVGSPAYMSPEQWGLAEVDHRTDIWSLGVLLFEMLTGQKPFEGEAMQLFPTIVAGPIPLVSDFVWNAAPEIVSLVSRCLDRDLARRIGSADELAEKLDRFAEGALSDPVAAAPSGYTFFHAPGETMGLALALPPPVPTFASAVVEPRSTDPGAGEIAVAAVVPPASPPEAARALPVQPMQPTQPMQQPPPAPAGVPARRRSVGGAPIVIACAVAVSVVAGVVIASSPRPAADPPPEVAADAAADVPSATPAAPDTRAPSPEVPATSAAGAPGSGTPAAADPPVSAPEVKTSARAPKPVFSPPRKTRAPRPWWIPR